MPTAKELLAGLPQKPQYGYDVDRFLDAVRQIESGGGKNVDHIATHHGAAEGDFGIMRKFWGPQMEARGWKAGQLAAPDIQRQVAKDILATAPEDVRQDPMRSRAWWYGGSGGVKAMGSDAGDKTYTYAETPGVEMPSINTDVVKFKAAYDAAKPRLTASSLLAGIPMQKTKSELLAGLQFKPAEGVIAPPTGMDPLAAAPRMPQAPVGTTDRGPITPEPESFQEVTPEVTASAEAAKAFQEYTEWAKDKNVLEATPERFAREKQGLPTGVMERLGDAYNQLMTAPKALADVAWGEGQSIPEIYGKTTEIKQR